MVRIDFVSLFPEMLSGALGHSILGRAQAAGAVRFGAVNPRDFAYDRHQKVDDTPFGGEPGMLIKAEPTALAVESLGLAEDAAVILTDPAGVPFTQAEARSLRDRSHLVFLCGHYEAFDERVHDTMVTDEVSIGDYVLTGGELPALVMTDAIVRLIPGSVGKEASAHEDSFYHGLLDYPHYTRPAEFEGGEVPAVLMGGNHAEVEIWRRQEALKRTYLRRPDLLAIADLTNRDRAYLARLERDCLSHDPQLVTVCLALNDARKGREGLETYKTNLTELVRRIREGSSADLLLVTPNTRGDALHEEGVADDYIRAMRAVAREQGVGLADVYAVYQGWIRAGAAPADLLSNRVSHPTREGHQIFANALIEFFQP